MTHVQKNWTANEAIEKNPSLEREKIDELRKWINDQPHLPKYISDEQLILFYHSCIYNLPNTKKCIEEYYRLRLKVPQFFENRDIESESIEKALKIL